jgi:glutamyl-tRNA reductase
MTSEYVGRLAREGRFWLVTIDGIGVTQARNLTEAQEMAEDLVEIVTGKAPRVVTLAFDGDISADIEAIRQNAEALDRLQAEYSANLRRVVGKLSKLGLTGADIAKALQLSPQRVSQLSVAARPRTVRGTATVGQQKTQKARSGSKAPSKKLRARAR